MRGRRAVVPLLTLMLATLLELSSVAAKSFTFGEAQATQAPAATELTGVEVGRNADGVTVTLRGNGRLAYGTLQEADRPPLRLVVDFPGVRPNVPAATPGQGALRRVRVALNNPPDTATATRKAPRLSRPRPEPMNDGVQSTAYSPGAPGASSGMIVELERERRSWIG